MPQVDFRVASIQAHGLPQSCVCCGNDEDDQLVVHPVGQPLCAGRLGAGCLFLFMGPVGWLIGAGVAYLVRRKKPQLQLPVCLLCRKANRYQSIRVACLLAAAALLFGVDLATHVALHGYGMTLAGFIALYGLIEYYLLNRQFSLRAIKASHEGVLVQIPDENYPALYQRHLDNALLYGSSVNLGTTADKG